MKRDRVWAAFEHREADCVPAFDQGVASDVASDMLTEGVYVKGFSYPVVPKGQARIRCQVSAVHTKEHLDRTVAAFEKVCKKHKVI